MLIDTSTANLVTHDGGAYRALKVESVDRSAHTRYAAILIRARERFGARRRLHLELRAYDNGAAFRLILPGPSLATARVVRETTEFAFPGNALCLAAHQSDVVNSHEAEYAPTAASQLERTGYYDLPLTCRTRREGETFALTESGIDDFAAAYLVRRPRGGPGVAIALAPRHDDARLAVVAPIPVQGLATPWRTIMIADRPEALVGSTLVRDLAPPSRIGDTRWIAPGKAAWAWWSGMLAPALRTGTDGPPNAAIYRRYIDFAGRSGLAYYLIDRGWAWRDPDGDDPVADVTRTTGGVDIRALVAFARARHVRLWLWMNWKALDRRMDAALALYQRLGIAGIKVDYLDRQDQQMVAFYHRLLSSAARHRLMVDIHGAFEPRGLDRTYPNFLTQEGMMGSEYNRWSYRVTASHDVELAYSRASIGPMDYAPGMFRNVAPNEFRPREHAPQTMTTRAHQLALPVVYPSPLLVLADAPSAYLSDGRLSPGAEFLRDVPTTWDETRGLAGDFGRWIAVARRKGDVWYVGIITNEQARTAVVPLAFLGPGTWRTESWIDGAHHDDIRRYSGTVKAGQGRLLVPLAAEGGAALRFTRIDAR